MKRTNSVEIERKFIVKEMPSEMPGNVCKRIQQGYLAIEPNREVRIRAIDGRYFITVKTGTGLSRSEVETEITKVQFMGLWPLTSGRRIEKTRYEYRKGEDLFEFDAFEGELEGLKIAEVEFASISASQQFRAPRFLGEEVTEDERYKNKALAMEGLPARAKLKAKSQLKFRGRQVGGRMMESAEQRV